MSKAWAGGSDTRWRTLRAYVLKRDGHVCRIGLPGCTDLADQVDHITPLAMGGDKYSEANCRAACRACNLARNKSMAMDYEPAPRKVSSW